MAIINTGLLTKGLRSEFFNRFEATPAHYRELATRIASNADRETYRWLGATPQMREWGQGRLTRGIRTESYSVENLKYESTIEVDRDELADDQTGQLRIRIAEMAERAATHKDFLLAQLLINGHEDAAASFDQAPFFSDAHVSGESGVQSNTIQVEVADDAAPTVEEFQRSLRLAISSLLSFRDDAGTPMPLNADGLFCVVPPSLYFTALEAISSTVTGMSTNVLAGVARVVAFPWLPAMPVWYLLKNNGAVRPFIFQDREPIEFNALADESEEAFKREKYLFGVRARYRLAYGYWQYALRCEFAAE